MSGRKQKLPRAATASIEVPNLPPPTVHVYNSESQSSTDATPFNSDWEIPKVTRSQKQRKKEAKLPKQCVPAGSTPAQTEPTQGQNSALHQPRRASSRRAETAQDSILPKTNAALGGGRGKDTHEERKINDAMWSRIAKAVDNAMGLEDPGSIQASQVTHIVYAILECALPVHAQLKPGAIEAIDEDMPIEERDSSKSRRKEARSKSSPKPSWANVTVRAPKPEKSKPTLIQPLKGSRTNERLMVRLGEELPYRNEYPFIFQKKANATLPSQVRIGKVAHINSRLALLPATGTSVTQLEEHCKKLALSFGTCQIEKNKNLEEVIAEIAAEAFEQLCNVGPEWARWLIPQGVDEDKLVEPSMIFAVCPRIAQDIPNATTAAATSTPSAPTSMKKTTAKMETRRALTLESALYAVARTKQAIRSVLYVLPTPKLKA
ncbi:hypothetical protein MMC31_001468 [Peltigera leucophlebia]|nr:hypothetical protein [Peltigera leucophlebia]